GRDGGGANGHLPLRWGQLLREDARVPSRRAAVPTARSQSGRSVENEAIAVGRGDGGTSVGRVDGESWVCAERSCSPKDRAAEARLSPSGRPASKVAHEDRHVR